MAKNPPPRGMHARQTGGFFYLLDESGLASMLPSCKTPDLFSEKCASYDMTMRFLPKIIYLNEDGDEETFQDTRTSFHERSNREGIDRNIPFHTQNQWAICVSSRHRFLLDDYVESYDEYKETRRDEIISPDEEKTQGDIPISAMDFSLAKGHCHEQLFWDKNGLCIGVAKIEIRMLKLTYAKIFSNSMTGLARMLNNLESEEEVIHYMQQTKAHDFLEFLSAATENGFIAPMENYPVDLINEYMTGITNYGLK